MAVDVDRIADRIYGLLPAIHRVRDAQPDGSAGPLQGLVRIIAREVAVLEENLAQLYDDEFIETCADWAVPYIGDLLGVRGLHPLPGVVQLSGRAYVANTIGYRRRKGTARVLEDLARDVTLWGANAVEFFQVLAWSQSMVHVRAGRGGFAEVRDAERMQRVGTPFDDVAHAVDVRRIGSGHGRYNIPNAGIFLWRLGARALSVWTPIRAVASDTKRLVISPLGIDVPLVTQPDPTQGAPPLRVPAPITRRAMNSGLPGYYGDGLSVSISIDGTLVDAGQVAVCDLSDVVDASGKVTGWAHAAPAGSQVAIDPERGRLALATGGKHTVAVTSYTAWPAAMGGGEYERAESFDAALNDPMTGAQPVIVPDDQPTIDAALAAVVAGGKDGVVVLRAGRYDWAAPAIDVPGHRVEVRADDPATVVLALGADLQVRGAGSQVLLNGLWVLGGAVHVDNEVDAFSLVHCTLVPGLTRTGGNMPAQPGAPSLVLDAKPDAQTQITVDHSVLGPIRAPALSAVLTVLDSIVDTAAEDPDATRTPVLVSGDLSAFPAITAAPPTVEVTIGSDGPHLATFSGAPADLADAAARLEAAIQAAQSTPAFTGTRVLVAENRLIIVPGAAGMVTITAAGADATATELQLTPDVCLRCTALLGGLVPDPLVLHSTQRQVQVSAASAGPFPATLAAAPADATAAAAELQAAIRGAGGDPALQQAIVTLLDGRLLAIPGSNRGAISVLASPADPSTAHDLRIAAPVPVLAGSPGGELAGAQVKWLRRSTLLGPLHVAEVEEASDCILLAPLLSDRRQAGCVRFSWVPAGSLTPRRYRCQPPEGGSATPPLFVSLRFGEPGYGQLSRACGDDVWRGASNEAEMGAYNQVLEPQRETNLLVALDEYLRFSMEAGIFYAS